MNIQYTREKIRHIFVCHRWFFFQYSDEFNNKSPSEITPLISKIWRENISKYDDKYNSLVSVGYHFDLTSFKQDEIWQDKNKGETVYAYIDKHGTFYEDWNFSIYLAEKLIKKYNKNHDKNLVK